ncbi:MAG: alpha/beta hydrolase [gamma proteobacterium endosymbiont of Lamellibrachia anaximandri]|nr:alpha/beta hydrolase [gamma proteobacterium endosymbiont of Lamellibrachia anaximandri]MBL3619178.1 alpha/beta hydrolase [gamma proteobacterium endosymbiont of Lamellibrachia anaximandri]
MPRFSLESLWPFVAIVVAVYGALLLVLYFSQSRLLYYPSLPTRAIMATPDQVGLSFETITLTTDDGITLHGWFLPLEKPRATLLFFHGNAGNISHRLDSLEIFHRLGLAVLIIDYRGFGQSEGRPTEVGNYRDAEAAWRLLTEQKKIPPEDILLFGRSLGGAVAARLASSYPVRGLILESAFTSVPDMAADLYPMFPVRWLSRFQFDTRAYLESVSCPVLVVHSPDDEIIPFKHGQQLYQAARQPKRFLEIGGSHNMGFLQSGDSYREGLERFITMSDRR